MVGGETCKDSSTFEWWFFRNVLVGRGVIWVVGAEIRNIMTWAVPCWLKVVTWEVGGFVELCAGAPPQKWRKSKALRLLVGDFNVR